MIKLTTLIASALSAFSVTAQIGGSAQAYDCATAVNITGIPYNSPIVPKYTTQNNPNTYNSTHACANTFANGSDFLFRFTPAAANSCITITLTAVNNNYAGLFLFDRCPNDTLSKCIGQAVNTDLSSAPVKTISIQNVQLTPGTTYYIMASSQSGTYQFDLSVTAGACGTVPTGTGCFASRNITSAPFTDTNSTCGFTQSYNRGNTKCGGATMLDGPEYTYRFVPDKNYCSRVTFKTDSIYSGLFIYEGCPTNPKSKCISNRTYAWTGELVINYTFLAGKEYYIVVGSDGVNSDCLKDYVLDISVMDDKGSTCDKAYHFPSTNHTFYNHTTQCKGDEYDVHKGCNTTAPNYMAFEDVVYTFNATAGECIGVTLKVLDPYKYAGVYLMSACPSDTSAKCLAFAGKYLWPGTDQISYEFTADTSGTYYIVIGVPYASTWTDYNFDYNLSLSSSTLDTTGIDCRRAHNISSIPFQHNDGSVACKGNNYNQTHACKSLYMAGNDYVYKFTATKTECILINTMGMDSKGGVFLLDSCPDRPGASCLAAGVCDFADCDSVSFVYNVTAGKTYYLVVASYQGTNSLTYDLEVRPLSQNTACNYCNTDICIACRNVGFERMDFMGWQGFTGSTASPNATAGMNSGPINNGDTRHTIMSAGSYDPMAGRDLSAVSPFGGKYSVRLGNRLTGNQGEMLTYTFAVDSNTQNFFYYYAVVFQDPGTSHAEAEKPYFRVRMFDQLGAEIQCAHYEVRAMPNMPDFKSTPNDIQGLWKDWTLVAVPLESYMGQTVTIEFTTLDCTQGGHYGYAYVDAFCGNVDIIKSDNFLCKDSSVTLTAPDGFVSYTWNTGETTKSISVTAPGTYSVVVRSASDQLLGCSATLTTKVEAAPSPTAAFSFIEGCKDAFITFNDQSAYVDTFRIVKWEWEFGDGTFSNDTSMEHEFPGPGTYDVTLTVYNIGNCPSSITQQIIIPEYPVFPPLNALDTLTLCEKDKTQLYADSIKDVTYQWTGPAGFSSGSRNPVLNNLKPQQTGWYYLQGILTTDTCQKKRDSTYIEVKEFPLFKIRKDTNICFHDTLVTLWAEGGERYSWTPATAVLDPAAQSTGGIVKNTALFQVLIDNNLCPDSLMQVKIVVDLPKAPLEVSEDINICIGDSCSLWATSDPQQYLSWTGPKGFTSNKTDFSLQGAMPDQEGYYKVKSYLGPNKYCQFGEDSVKVNLYPLPNLVISPENPNLCPGDMVQLIANGAVVYTWFYEDFVAFSSESSVNLKPDSTTMFHNEGKNSYGCEALADALVKVKEQFSPDLGPDKKLCKGETATVTLNTSSFYKQPSSITWNTGQAGPAISVKNSGNYWVTVTIEGCTKTDSIYIEFIDPAAFTLGADRLLCQGDSFLLDVTSYGGNVTWQDGSTSPARNVMYPGGEYNVTVISGVCTLKDTIKINFQDLHTVDIGPDVTVCLGTPVTASSNQQTGSFLWKEGTQTSTDPTYTVSSAGIHDVSLEHQLGVCKAYDSKRIWIETPPVPNLGPDTTVCENQSVTLDPKIPAPATYLWNDGSALPVLVAAKAGQYDVTVTKGACTVFDTLIINHDAIPVFDLGPNDTICEDNTRELDATVTGNAAYLWNTGATTPKITINKTGAYHVQITRGKCTAKDTMSLNVDLIPVFSLGPDSLLCTGQQIMLSPGITADTYAWTTGAATPAIQCTQPGVYGLTLTRGTCTYTDAVQLSFQDPPQLDIGPDALLCLGQQVSIGTSIQADQYQWNTGEKTPSITINQTGDYILVLTQGPCVVRDTMHLQVNSPPVIDLGPDETLCETVNKVLDVTTPGATYQWNTGSQNSSITVVTGGTYQVTVTQGPCVVSDNITITLQKAHTVELPADIESCIGRLETVAFNSNAVNPVTLWHTGETTSSITVGSTGIIWVEVTDGVCVVRDSMFAEFSVTPQIDLGPDELLCAGTIKVLDAYFPGASYTWNTDQTTPQINVEKAGTYKVRAYIKVCETFDEITINFQDPPVVELGPDVELCEGEYRVLALNIPNAQFSWNTGETTPSVIIRKTGPYQVTVSQPPCQVTDAMNLLVHPLPAVNLKDTMICPTDSAWVDAFCPGCTYKWRDGLTEPTRWTGPRTMLFVTVTSDFGCVLHTDVSVELDKTCWEEIFVPNTFTPNGDGYNDRFKVEYGNVNVTDIIIVDRWGEVLYRSSDPDEGWDGKKNGDVVKEDVYIWKVTYRTIYNEKKVMKGHVNLLK